ncbi:hypothetical protein HOLleu_18057 [Holothuria leucospilota]|uniref:Uncharacterized protein n=1 Tax=Holothuria leucospilota TaxID=206669 RepID=A0A9Q1C295_HOLLE|nr:hypothetical protein HOLleu_18057 [Holothuria leucospilota]
MDYQTFTVDRTRDANRQKGKWPPLFWSLLMTLGLFHHKFLVTDRKCFACHVKHIRKRKFGLIGKPLDKFEKGFQIIDSLKLSYERNAKAEGDTREMRLLETDNEKVDCEVCLSLWWNSKGQPCMYTDEQIGIFSVFTFKRTS